jgi:DNA-directed RNA polymerase specialized sigma24 family protein
MCSSVSAGDSSGAGGCQPRDGLEPVSASDLGELEAMDPDVARAALSLARRYADRQKIEDLAAASFSGPQYEVFKTELAAYGYPVMLSWIGKGTVFKACADRGRPLNPTDQDRERLAGSRDDRSELALETVAEALRFFRRHALVQKKWSWEAGAALATYFVGACISAFPNVFRRWQREQQRWQQDLAIAKRNPVDERPLTNPECDNPADVVADIDLLRRELRAMDDKTRPTAALAVDGHSQAEIAEYLGTTERAVEGRLYRYRLKRGRRDR